MRKSMDVILFNIIAYSLLGILALLCVLPFIMLVSGSFSEESLILRTGYGLLPKGFSLRAYEVIFSNPQKILTAYGVSIFVSCAACILALLLISMTAYVLSRKDFRSRNFFAFLFYFTTLFNGGLVPFYILMVRYLHLKNNLLALILPGILNIFFLFIMRNFMTNSIPDALIESAKIDGAGDFNIYFKIVLPLVKPALATIGLFELLGHWNNWYNAMLYIQKEYLYPLQYLLYLLLASARAAGQDFTMGLSDVVQETPAETLKLAMTVVVIGPIVLAYPFVQKYFVKGITIGAIKG
ncbi:MAG: carbohydrate ABC transporter permease [Bacteroidota bacterium]